MADYTKSAIDARSAYPENAVDAHEWGRMEPVLSPQQLTRRFLWGIPLVSAQMNPITRKYDTLEAEDLQDMILRAVGLIEMDSKIDIFPVKRSEKKPFDRNEMAELGYMRANYRPILSIDKLSIAPGNSPDIITIAPEWLSKDGWTRGEVRIIPTIGTIGHGYMASDASIGNGGGAFIAMMAGRSLPSFWKMEYTTGFADGIVPRPLNELIGAYAAIEALSLLATTNRSNSQSIGMDGMSQSIGTAGPQVYDARIKVLEERKAALLNKFRAQFGNKWNLGNI